MSKYISIPTTWTTYLCEDDIVAVLGASIQTPPHIVLEMLVANGLAKKISAITTTRAADVGDEEDGEEGESKMPWLDEQ